MVGRRTQSQALVLKNENEQACSDIVDKIRTKKAKEPMVRSKRYKVLAGSFDIKVNGTFEKQLQGIFKRVTGHGSRRNTHDRAKEINNLVSNKNFVFVNENQIELHKTGEAQFCPIQQFYDQEH